MPANRAEFQVALTSKFDSEGIDAAKNSYAALSTQLKAMKADIEAAERSGVSVPAEAKQQLQNLEKTVENYGRVAHEAGASTHEVKEALHLVRDAAGDALGPIGELAHFLGNPYVLAAAGAIAAIKMLVEQHQALRDELEKNIAATRDIQESFAHNYTAAVNQATEATAEFHRTLARAGEVQNQFAAQLTERTALIHEQATAVSALAAAYREYYDANIQGAQLTGQMTGPEGHAAEEHARQQERAQTEQAERDSHAREVGEQRRQASDAQTASDEARDQAELRTPQRVRNEASISDLQDEAERRKKTAGSTSESEDKAKAAALLAGARPTAAQAAGVAGTLAAARAAHQAGATGMVEGEAEALDIEKRIEAYKKFDAAAKAHSNALGDVATSEQRLAEAKIKAADFDAETARLQTRAETLRTFAETTNRAADAAERLNQATEAAHGPVDRVQDATRQQQRRNYLIERHNNGQATPDEQAEYGGMTAQNPRQAITDAQRRIQAITTNVRIFEGGHVSAQEFTELQLLNDRMLGLLEDLLTPGRSQDTIHSLTGRIADLEQTARNHAGWINRDNL